MTYLSQLSSYSPSKRRVFFSFHYQNDIWRVNQVRNSWRFGHENTRDADGFFDASIWEASQRTGPDSLKQLIRNGIKNSSVTCVLVGAHTFERRWVRYEIARSVIKGNGIFTVNIHLLADQVGSGSILGANPLDCIGVYNYSGKFFLAEIINGNWKTYGDYSQEVYLPANWWHPTDANVIPLSHYCPRSYCFVIDDGYANFASWTQHAAANVGR